MKASPRIIFTQAARPVEPDILERMQQMFDVCECSDEVCLFGPDDERCVLCPSHGNGLFFSLLGEAPPDVGEEN